MKKLLFALLTITFSISLFAQEKLIVRFDNPDQEIIKEFTKASYDVAAYKPGEFLDLVVTEANYKKMVLQGYQLEVVNSTAQMAANLGNVDDINGYRTYAEALEELQQIAADNPDICKLIDIGDSRGKEYFDSGYGDYGDYQHDIWAMKVSDNVEVEEDETAVYYFGAHHAREPLSTEVAFYVLNHIVDNYGTDPGITENVNSKEIWFVPIVNPDGHEVVLNQINLDWRKNIRDNDGNGSFTNGSWDYPDGVDPNRNYGWEWGNAGTSHDPTDLTYCGPSPFSEPELQAIRDLMIAKHFVAGISYHTYSELVLWPYGYSSSAPAPDLDALAGLGTMMGNAIPGISGGHYTPKAAWELYPCSGVTDDYAYGQHGIFSYTIELATEFIPPANQVYQITEDNLDAALILLNRSNYSMLTGHVSNAGTGAPVHAEIFIEGIDNSGAPREPYTSNEEFGTYNRLLTNGTYSVTINAFGYLTQTFDNVVITDDGQTILDVALVASEIVSITGVITDAATGLPIEGASIEVLDTPIDPVFSNASGEYSIDELFENNYTFKIYALDYSTLIQVVNVDPQNTTLDFVLNESFAVSFETGEFEEGWDFAGNADWLIDNSEAWDGSNSAKSGAIGDESTTEILYVLENASGGQISFYRKVSSESGYDFFQFYIDGTLQDQWAGEQDWEEFVYDVNAGTHTFKWVYEKDQSVSNGDDCAWIDFVTFPPAETLSAQAGPNAEICEGEVHQCDGVASNYTDINWTSDGDGEFSDANILNPVYTPGSMDIENGLATLTLTASDGQGGEVADDLNLSLSPLPATASDISGAAQVCAGNAEIYNCDEIENATECEWVLSPEQAGSIEVVSDTEIVIAWADGYYDEAIVKVRGMNDCGYGEYSQDMIVSVEDCTGIGENENSSFSIYPNPATDWVVITLDEVIHTEFTVRVYNLLGKLVFEYQYEGGSTTVRIDFSQDNEGIFFVEINDGEASSIQKLILNK